MLKILFGVMLKNVFQGLIKLDGMKADNQPLHFI